MKGKNKIILNSERKSLYERYKNGEFKEIIQNKGCSINDYEEYLFFMGYLIANAINEGQIIYNKE